jgi:hypothetical protein
VAIFEEIPSGPPALESWLLSSACIPVGWSKKGPSDLLLTTMRMKRATSPITMLSCALDPRRSIVRFRNGRFNCSAWS